MIRIAHIITCLAAHGAEMMLYKLLRRVDRRQFSPVVVSLTGDGPLTSRIEELGVPVYSCGMHPRPSAIGSMVRLVRYLRSVEPDLLQGWMYHGNLAAQLASAVLPGVPPVVWNIRGCHHRLTHEKPSTAAVIWLGARLSGLPHRIINNSATSAKLHETHLGFRSDRWEIVPNGFELDVFSPSLDARASVRAELALPPDALLIGLIGRYDRVKDHTNFLRAAAIVRSRFLTARFVLAGAGVDPANTALNKDIQWYGLRDCVHLLGERTDIPCLTASLDIAVSSSVSEGFPNVIGEAMACGVPCVVTDVGDSRCLVGATGLIVPPKDSAALSAALVDLIAQGPQARRELGLAARRRIERLFSIDSIAEQYAKVYRQVIETQEGKGYRRCAV